MTQIILLLLIIYVSFFVGRTYQAYLMDYLARQLEGLVLCPPCMKRFVEHLEKLKFIKSRIKP